MCIIPQNDIVNIVMETEAVQKKHKHIFYRRHSKEMKFKWGSFFFS